VWRERERERERERDGRRGRKGRVRRGLIYTEIHDINREQREGEREQCCQIPIYLPNTSIALSLTIAPCFYFIIMH